MPSDSSKISNAASSVSASSKTYSTSASRYNRHSKSKNSFSSSSTVPIGTCIDTVTVNESPIKTSSFISSSVPNMSESSQNVTNQRSKNLSTNNKTKMESNVSSQSNDKVNSSSLNKPKDAADNKVSTGPTNETVNSLASNLESSLTVNSPNTSTLSLESSVSSNNNDTSNVENNNNENLINNSSLESSAKTLNVPKFGIPVPNRVFVGGIPIDATENDVRNLFAQYGTINSVKIITDRARVSKGYGFVTYETEEDAQKVIKEAENLIIKNRKLNVSTAVMKQQNSFDSRAVHNGSFMCQPISFGNSNNFNQYYENFHSVCPAEGLPIYQIAGVNGHFVSNCPSLIASPAAQYMPQPAASAFSSPYQTSTGFIYSGVPQGAASSIQLSSQHPLYHAQSQHGSQHLISGSSLPPAHQFPYSAAAYSPQTGSNNSSIHPLRYSIPPTHHHSSTQSTQQVNLNGQQYIQFSNTTSPAISHASMHLPPTLPMHLSPLHPLNSVSDVSNTVSTANPASNISSGATNQINSAIIHHHPGHHASHQSTAMYTNYTSNMAVTHPLTTNTTPINCVQNVHIKTDSSSIDMIDNGIINANGTNSASNMTQLSATMHLVNNGGYPPNLIEMVWPASHMQNTYCSNSSIPINSSNSSNYGLVNSNTINAKGHQTSSANRNLVNNNNVHAKISAHNSTNGHINNSVSLPTNNNVNIPSTVISNSISIQNNSSAPFKDKPSNPRQNNSSYCPSHKKMYNGNSHNYVNSNSKSKLANGSVSSSSINTTRYSSSSEPSDQSISDQTVCTTPKAPYSKLTFNQPSTNSSTPIFANQRSNSSNVSTNISQTFVTKTVNGVQIYALADNSGEAAASVSTMVADNSSTDTPPLGSEYSSSSIIAYKA